MNFKQETSRIARQAERGLSALGIMFLVLLVFIIMFGIDQLYIFYTQNCINRSVVECIMGMGTPSDAAAQGATVTARGAISGSFNGENHSVDISLTIPTAGGAVTGSFSGDCSGKIQGTYSAADNVLSGEGHGSCAYIFPASGTFTGSVNQSAKSVPVTGKGSASGFTKEGSLTLKF